MLDYDTIFNPIITAIAPVAQPCALVFVIAYVEL